MTPSKLSLFYFKGYQPHDENVILRSILEQIASTRKNCGYTFEVPTPVSIEVKEHVRHETVNKIFGGTKEVETVWYAYNLVFNKELTEAELNMWRMLKMGWLSARLLPLY